MICFSSNLAKALSLAGAVEDLAQQYTISKTLGEPVILDSAEMAVILAKFKTYGKQMLEIEAMGDFCKTHAVVPPIRKG
eukprot:m.77527 g.77527  ORF g.77527 m.77527 type:complete len:79 (-) comp25024_c0_seq1:23-259(-)